MNSIDHDSWNLGEKRIGRRAPILIAQPAAPGSTILFGRERGHDRLETRIAAVSSKVAILADRNLSRGFEPGNIGLIPN
jgi:hypothetical protein